jgi:hypothetical protein
MSPPVYQDNESIPDKETLLRRVHLLQLVEDSDTGLARVSSGAFKDQYLSVNFESILTEYGNGPEACLANHQAHKLISFSAGAARQVGQALCHDPLPEDISHGLVFGSKNANRVLNGLKAAAVWIIPSSAPRYADIEADKGALGI